jgi:hypothetical protein
VDRLSYPCAKLRARFPAAESASEGPCTQHHSPSFSLKGSSKQGQVMHLTYPVLGVGLGPLCPHLQPPSFGCGERVQRVAVRFLSGGNVAVTISGLRRPQVANGASGITRVVSPGFRGRGSRRRWSEVRRCGSHRRAPSFVLLSACAGRPQAPFTKVALPNRHEWSCLDAFSMACFRRLAQSVGSNPPRRPRAVIKLNLCLPQTEANQRILKSTSKQHGA